MLTRSIHHRRRERLRALLPEGLVLLGGHRQIPLNLVSNLSARRQSSHILYLTGVTEPSACVLLVQETGRFELFLPPQEPGDEVWHGPMPSLEELGETAGADAVFPLEELEARLDFHRRQGARGLHSLPSSDPSWSARMAAQGVKVPELGKLDRHAPSPLADAMIKLRLTRDAEELAEMREAVAVTAQAYQAAMGATRPGGHEAQIRGLIEAMFMAAGMRPSYDPIVTVHGEILHCHSNPHRFKDTDLLLVDAGCETPTGYAADVTRTWPVRGHFDSRQKAIYEVVLEAEKQCISKVKAGAEMVNLHLHACRVITEGLKELKLLRGSVDSLVESDAHALFFPHGLGHLLGLDVHDLEDLGDRAGYAPGRKRSSRFGLGYLRLHRVLEAGMVITIEPGVYFIPGLLNNPEIVARYQDQVDFDRARTFLGLGGIRIEDDVVVTTGAPEVLTSAIPKEVAAVEAVIGSCPEALGAISKLQPAGG